MTAQAPIKTLADAQAWLEALHPGDEVRVGSSLFDPGATLPRQLFAVLPQSDPIVLTVATVNASTAQLSGTATVLGDAGTTATFQFTQPGTVLRCDLTLVPPASLQWSLLSDLDVSFTGITASLIPDATLGVVGMSLACTVQAGKTDPLEIPVTLSVPSFDGDWLLTAGETQVKGLKPDALGALAGGQDVTAILAKDLVDLSKFTLTGFELVFNPVKDTCSLIRIGVQYGTQGSPAWTFFNDAFAVDSVGLEFEILGPLGSPTLQATLFAEMEIKGGPRFDVGGQFPDKVVFTQLAPGSEVSVTNAFKFFGVELPSGFPDVEISRLGFVLYTEQDALDFRLGIDKPVPIVGKAQLDAFDFEIRGAYDQATKKIIGSGTLAGTFTFGETTLVLSGAYATDAGVRLAGRATDVPIGELIDKLLNEFEIKDVPEPIRELELKTIGVSVDSGAKTFSFDCEATTTIAGVGVDFKPSIVVSHGDAGFSATFDGTLVLHAPDKDLTFTYHFTDQKSGTSITAQYLETGDGLQFANITAALGFDAPPIPDGLELHLLSVTFSYDFTNSILVLEAQSKNYGKAVLVAAKTTAWSFFFGLDINHRIALSDLPLLGKGRSEVVSVAIDDIQVLVSSKLDDKAAKVINGAIVKAGGTYPQVPVAGMSGVALAMVFDAGGDKTTLAVKANPSQGQQLDRPTVVAALPAAPGPPPPPPSDGTVWLNLQKSFGPIAFQKVGIRYRDSKLAFLMNASLSEGGLTIAVMGLGVDSKLTTFEPRFTIDGLAITYASGPVELSGALVGTIDPLNFYGELILGVEQLQIAALGGYCEVDGHPSFFLYAVLDYPIGGPSFFFVTGLAAGFGFNRRLVIPPVDGVAAFPLVQWAQGSGNPPPMDTNAIGDAVTKVITELSSSGVIAPSVGDDWLAVGVKFSSFELVQSFALLIVEFGTRFEIALLGISSVQLPPAPAPPVALAQLELEAAFVPSEGILSISGQLTPQSFVLSRDCHLTGGFALYTWFSGDHEGEFVVTLGGYSPRFTPPPYYPVVPRLGLNWQVTPDLAVTGNLYFALTSSAVMAGGGLSAVWHSGDIRAWFDVEADFLLVFEPFHYYISVGIHLGASFTIDLLFTSVTISIHVGVGLEIWGPEFAGKATIDLSIISFTISFGTSSPDSSTKIGWGTFLGKLIPTKPAAAQLRSAADAPIYAVVQIVVQDGLVKRLSDNDDTLNWVVNGQQLTLATQSAIPTKDWSFSPNITLAPDAPTLNTEFGVGPVGVADGELTSRHEITITSKEPGTFHASPLVRNVPTALWQTRKFDGNGVPVGLDPLKDTTVEGVGVGFTITPFVEPPDHTLPIPLVNLEYTIVTPIKTFTWTDAVAPETDPFTDQTVRGTIAAAGPTAVRTAVVAEIAKEGWQIPTTLDVSELSSESAYDLSADPILRLLGEQR